MAVRQTYLFDEGPAGASPTVGGDLIEVSGATYTASAMHGPFALFGSAIGNQYVGINNSGTVNHSGSIYVKPSVQASGANRFVNVLTSSAALIFAIRVHSDGHFDISSNVRLAATTLSWTANQWYRVDWQYDQTVLAAPTLTVRVFTSPEGSVPAETIMATQSGIGNNMAKWRLGLFSTSGTTATSTVDTFRVADGLTWIGPYNPSSPPGSVTQSVAGAPTQTGFGVVSKLVGATSVRLKVATDQALTQNVTYVAAQTPDSLGYVRHAPTGLSAGTQYYYQLADTPSGGAETLIGTVGKLKTLKPAGTPQNFRVALGACITQAAADSTAMDDWTAWNADLNIFTGDLDYSGTQATDLATQVQVYETQIASAAGLKNMLANAFGYYCTSDHEAGPDNGDSGSATSGGVYTATNIAAYKQVFPYGTLGDTTNSPVHGRYQSWVMGRIRFIMIDIRNLDRSAGAGTDGVSKTMLGALQLQWLKDQLVQAELLKVIISDVAWMGPASITNAEDKWWSYDNERQQIISYIAANRAQIGNVMLWHGDSHCLGVATPLKNTWGNFPVYCAAAMHNIGGGRNLTAFSTYWNNSGGNCRHYGRITFTDDGTTITSVFSGWDAASQVERVTQTDTFISPGGRGKVWNAASSSWKSFTPKVYAGGVPTTAKIKVWDAASSTWKLTKP